MNRRGLRLELVAGVGIALAMLAFAQVAEAATGTATSTTLTPGTLSGCTQALSIDVTASGSAISGTGTVTIEDEFDGNQVQLASVPVTSGAASATVNLEAGSHSLTAVFDGNTTYLTSTSAAYGVTTTTQCEFTLAVSNLSPTTSPVNTLTPGQSGTSTITVTPSIEYTSTLTNPMFVTLSCSGLPDEATCTFTPQSVEISSTTTGAVTSSMVIATQESSSNTTAPFKRRTASPIAWALMLPGVLGLGGFAFGARRRRWLQRLSLVLLVGLVATLGATGCNPRYDYYNHGPSSNPSTPAGTYTVTVTAEYSNGVSAAYSQNATLALTVN